MSKFLSLVLRHRPDLIGIQLDTAGWVEVDRLLEALERYGRPLDRAKLVQIVTNDNKSRYAFSPDGRKIRANQGHSVAVELGYAPQTPPVTLYHGTPERNVSAILRQGLHRGQRHHVHLSADIATARSVGQRRGPARILRIDAAAMHRDGHPFLLSENGVWLVSSVPVQYLTFLDA